MGVEQKDIGEAGLSTPKHAAGSIAKGLATLPRVTTTPKSKGKGKSKAREEEEEEIKELAEDSFTDKCLAALLHWQKALTVVDMGIGARVVLEKVKGKSMVLLAKQQAFSVTTAGPRMTQKAADTQLGPNPAIAATVQGRAACTAGSHQGVLAESLPRGLQQSPASVTSTKQPRTVASEEEKKETENVEMREKTPLVTIAEVEPAGTWSSTPLQQVNNNKLEWLGEDLAWPTLLMSAMLLWRYNKRVAGVERQFGREMEKAKEELLEARARFTVTKQLLATLVGYQGNCQAFLAWQEENNIGKEDWEEGEMEELPSNNTDLNA
ncbi:hypothetical protein C0989_009458 [Termitomyces sp. Mn162]|nr:hypothetical protein C0989_009458 [Termitomyces sp. Mn162]